MLYGVETGAFLVPPTIWRGMSTRYRGRLRLACFLVVAGQVDTAAPYFDEVLKSHPEPRANRNDLSAVYYGKAVCAFERGDSAGAITALAPFEDELRQSSMRSEADLLIVKLLGTGTCTIDRAAQHLGVDRRTIHRRLAREGQTFSGLVEAVRRELAERYVSDPHRSLMEVSLLLGFSAPTAFSRWYRQHFNAKPSERRSGPETK
jgi:AraC-like DNA-binding protein